MKMLGHELERTSAWYARWLVAGACLFAALPAAAQEDVEELPDLDQEQPVEAPARTPPPPGAGEAEPQVSETHSVQGGDTLWDLCSKYLNSPWYWPKIWSYNPQISNPHWIYPGNELRFYPSDENLPTNVEVSRAMSLEDGDDSGEVPEDLFRTIGEVRVGRIPQNSVTRVRLAFVESSDHKKAGSLDAAFTDSYMLSPYQKAYVKFDAAAKPGDDFAIYRTLKEIEHPVTGEPYGYAVEVVGVAKVTETSEGVAGVIITRAYREIERGDWVGTFPEASMRRVSPTPGSANAKGYIMETMEVGMSEIGEHEVVFVDRGSAQGVQLGNVFTVLKRGDGYLDEVEGLPNEEVGKILVIDVRENASTGVVVRAINELSVGDKIELRAGEI